MSMVLYCVVCEHDIEELVQERFHYDIECGGPYCDRCWRWQKQIDELKARVVELEKPPVQTKRCSLYDLSAVGRRGAPKR